MTEAQLTRVFIIKLKATLGPSYTIFKHNDRITKGIPDLSISDGKGRTLWIEFKKNREASRPEHQRLILRRLGGVYVFLEEWVLSTGEEICPPLMWIHEYFLLGS